MNYSRLQYITDSPGLAEEACQAGVNWVQARIKNKTHHEVKVLADEILTVCKRYGAVCIVNDHPDIALEIGADGVHVGRTDKSIAEVREILGGRKMIIGGTANTLEDVKKLTELKVDYIGLGPFRFTNTKDKLSPILGLEGYDQIMNELHSQYILSPPVYAIGGIEPNDVMEIVLTGVFGVAVSGAIAKAKNKSEVVNKFYSVLNEISHGK